MAPGCQMSRPFAIAVSGVAGSGKSTLGRALARHLRAPLLDLDTVTNPVLDALGTEVFGGHWLSSSSHAVAVRRGRYAALLATAAEVLATAGGVVLVAPFTAELAGGAEWRDLVDAVRPAELRMVQVVGSPELLAARRAARGTERDRHRTAGPTTEAVVPVVTVEASRPTRDQLARLLSDLGVDAAGVAGRHPAG